MTFKADFNDNLTTYTTAQTLVNLDMSVIPVYPNKVAATSWTHFQHRQPTQNHLYHWFVRDGHEHLAIICGQVSRLIVLDFDHPALFARFKRKHPELTNTLIIKTRRGWHLYYRIPACVYVQSRHGNNIDLLAEGKYAIAPPSIINGHQYSINHAAPIMEITEAQIQQIETFVGGNTIQPDIHELDQSNPYTIHELQNIYRRQSYVGNRNNALFMTALAARDTGWAKHETLTTLTSLHVKQGRAHENPNAREREAFRTIKSAFSRPPRSRKHTGEEHLCNTLLEALKGIENTRVIRVWSGLMKVGIKAGQYISADEAYVLLKPYGIGRDSIREALNFETAVGRLFTVQKSYKNPSPRPPTPANAAISTSPDVTTKCYLLSQTKSGKTQSTGRKKHFFCMPTQQFGAYILNVKLCRTADPLTLEDLSTAKATRHAIHRGLIQRRPGYYGSWWLARRLGVHVVTKNRYDNQIPDLHKSARYYDIRIDWDNLGTIADAAGQGGVFLEDMTTSKRYPASIGVARNLLKQRHEVFLRKQTRNFYWVGSGFSGIRAESDIREIHIQQALRKTSEAVEIWREAATAYWNSLNVIMLATDAIERAKTGQNQAQYATTNQPKQEARKQLKKSRHDKTGKPPNPRRKMQYAEDERLVEHLQQRINALSADTQHYISKRTLRGLIYAYGKRSVKRAIAVVEKRDNVANPAGFLIVKLRSDAKFKVVQALSS